jgi:2',3'-cyclic-nucleotide 2'-phosphodiesterase (5'-nucleotidase family)
VTLLTILHTNDLHGHIQSLPRIATLAKRIRREVEATQGHCVLWDAGDAEDPSLLESSMTKGSAVMAMLCAAGYSLAVLGNATPLRYGLQAIQGLAERLGQPLLCANIIDPDTGQPVAGLTPYTIQTFGEAKVGIIGLTAPMSIYSFFRLTPSDPLLVLPDLIDQVRSLGAQTVILLSHLGSEADKQIAQQVTGLDVIIGGHDHVALNPPLAVNDTIIAQAGDYGRFLGRLDLQIDLTSGKIVLHHGELLPVGEEIPLDADTQAAIETERGQVQQMMQHVIGELCAPLDWAEDRQCAAGNLLADVLLDRVKGAQVALALAGHWRVGLPAGPVTVSALHASMRSTANPARVELTGEQIAQFLREALKPENAARRPRPLRGAAIGMPHVAGMRVRYDPGSFELLEAWIGDEPLQLHHKYVVAATDLELYYDFINYLLIPQEQIELELPTIVPEVLEDYFAGHSPLSIPIEDRITP